MILGLMALLGIKKDFYRGRGVNTSLDDFSADRRLGFKDLRQ